ncbi:hypothetical protein QUF80_21120 [Desulfococcaceae bacterium HSG8]|nr:hypothetical protein [Desulfococcaceae bacterium HSG8]
MVGYASLHPPYIFGYFIFGEIPDEKDIFIIYWLKGNEKIEEKPMFVKLEKNLGGLPGVLCEAKPDLRGLGVRSVERLANPGHFRRICQSARRELSRTIDKSERVQLKVLGEPGEPSSFRTPFGNAIAGKTPFCMADRVCRAGVFPNGVWEQGHILNLTLLITPNPNPAHAGICQSPASSNGYFIYWEIPYLNWLMK